jgi:hypothetical protein
LRASLLQEHVAGAVEDHDGKCPVENSPAVVGFCFVDEADLVVVFVYPDELVLHGCAVSSIALWIRYDRIVYRPAGLLHAKTTPKPRG